MSDNRRTPQGTARVNSERFDTELAAVWYAANYYYEVSERSGREYIGVVFRDGSNKFGITVRGDGGFTSSTVRIGDVPTGTVPTAVWHTHPAVPSTASLGSKIVLGLLGVGLLDDDFSSADIALADRATVASRRLFGHPISIYLATATVIKRYRPGLANPEKTWGKEPPARMSAR